MGPTISVADGRVTVSGTFDWQRVSTQGIDLRSQSTSYTFSFSAAGTPFDPDFAAPSTGNAVELASDADLRVGDPLVGGVDQWQDVAFGVYNFEEGSLHPDFRDDGVAVDAVWSLVPEGSFDSDQRYIFTIGMNEDFTAIETVSVELQFRDVIVNFLGEVSGYTTSYYHGVDAPAAPISIGTLIGVPTNIPTAGNDVLDYSGESAGQTVNGLAGNDTMIGTQVADTLRGDGGADTIRGNNGWDTLSGGQGWDTLVGGRGNETLFGGRGNDTLFGGAATMTFWGQGQRHAPRR
jgi:Ca2+-binding RTX toxin-like protein